MITVAVAVAAAIPSGGTSLLAAGLTVSAATASAIAAGVGLAATAIEMATAPKPKGAGGSQTAWKADPDAGLPYAIGRTMVGGNIIYKRAYGKDNAYESLVSILSCAGPVQSIESVLIDKTATTFTGGAAVGSLSGRVWHASQLGASPEASALTSPQGAMLGWTNAHKLSGYAASVLTLKYDAKGKHTFTREPMPGWVGHWVKCYDPRLDSTYPGGSGSCRALNEATYVWSENPWIHAITWCLGRWQNGKRIIGLGLPANGIDMPSYVEAANIADANGWKIGGLVYSRPDTKWNVLQQMCQAGGGIPVALGARVSCVVNTPRVSLATFTQADLRGEVSVNATQARRDRINAVVPRYRDEASNWEMVPAKPIEVADYIAVDGGRRTKEIEYTLVQDLAQASTLARYDIENAREFGPITLPAALRWYGYKPGDCITVTVAEVGLAGQKVLLLNRSLDPATGVVTHTARSETDAKHPFALGQTGVAPPTPGVNGPPLVPTPDAGDWAIVGTSIIDGTATKPALVVSGASQNPAASQIIFEYRVYTGSQGDDDDWVGAGAEPPTTTRKQISSVQGGTAYQVSVRYSSSIFYGDRLILGPVTTASTTIAQAAAAAAAAAAAQADAAAALTQLTVIESDGWLSAGEKPEIIRQWTAIYNEAADLDAKAYAIGVSPSTFDTARANLAAYLVSLNPAWDNTAFDTAIVPATFNGKFTDYYYARSLLLNAIAQAAAQKADWSGVTGGGKPADNATRNDDGGNMLPTPATLDRIILGNATREVTGAAGRPADSTRIFLGTMGVDNYVYWSDTPIQVKPLETLWFQHAVYIPSGGIDTVANTVDGVYAGFAAYKSDGSSNGFGYIGGSASRGTPPTDAWVVYVATLQVPAGTATINPFTIRLNAANHGGKIFVSEPLLTRHQPGADVTAGAVSLDTSNVGGVPSATVNANIAAAQSLASSASGIATAANAFALDVQDGNTFSKDEKKRYINLINGWDTSVPALVAQGNALGLVSQAATLGSAYTTFKNYLISVHYSTLTSSDAISRTTFLANEKAFSDALTALSNAAKKMSGLPGPNILYNGGLKLPLTTAGGWSNPSGFLLYQDAAGNRVVGPAAVGGFSLTSAKGVVCFPGETMTLSANCGGAATTARYLLMYVEWRNYGNGAHVSSSQDGGVGFAVQVYNETLYGTRRYQSFVVPGATDGSGYVVGYVTIFSASDVATPSDRIFQQIKFERGASATAFSDEATDGANLANGIGRIGSGRANLPTNFSLGLTALSNIAYAPTQTNAGSSVTVNLPAVTYTLDTGATISYPTSSVAGLAYSTTYYFYRNDPNLDGGTSYGVSTFLADAMGSSKTYLGYMTTMSSSGTGGTGGGGARGGGGTNCPAVGTIIATDAGDVAAEVLVRAGALRLRSLASNFQSLDWEDLEEAAIASTEHCVRIVTENGCAILVSGETPLTTRSGRWCYAMQARLAELPTRIVEHGAERLEWSKVAAADYAGLRRVVRVRCHHATFAGGETADRMILTHNPYK